ncbi:Gfo/Idh/MocA family protein [Pseudonocardia sp. GCM10023141]|uniref:Gfo/Idh/MocA family protein n=1 Tax=Pseudonocardia sp. GCM10023141 TaxID=3252653 RepID=UPI0036170A08
MERLRVGLVGGGPWARLVHGPALAAHPDVEFAAVWARRPEVTAELAAQFGTHAVADPDELFADVDVVAFAVPPQAQGELAVRAAAAGRHLICEKPLADTLDAARAVAAAVERAGVLSSMVLTLRHDPDVQKWLADIPTATAGIDTVGSARWLSGALLGGPFATSPWRGEHGALLDIGPHVIDLLDAALGPVSEVEWVHRGEPDLTRFGLLHAGGARSTSVISLRMPIDPSEIEFTVFGGAGRHRLAERSADARGCFTRLVDELVAAVRGTGPAPALDAAHGLRLQEVVEQVRVLGRG